MYIRDTLAPHHLRVKRTRDAVPSEVVAVHYVLYNTRSNTLALYAACIKIARQPFRVFGYDTPHLSWIGIARVVFGGFLRRGLLKELFSCCLGLHWHRNLPGQLFGCYDNASHVRKEPPGATPIQGNGRERGHRPVLHYQTLLARKVSSEFGLAVFEVLQNGYLCRYKRVFCVGSKGITTLNPGTGEVTNQVRIAAGRRRVEKIVR